jgi:hypothetical protein
MTLINLDPVIINVDKITSVHRSINGDVIRIRYRAENDNFKFEGDKAHWLWQKLTNMCLYDYEVDKEDEKTNSDV